MSENKSSKDELKTYLGLRRVSILTPINGVMIVFQLVSGIFLLDKTRKMNKNPYLPLKYRRNMPLFYLISGSMITFGVMNLMVVSPSILESFHRKIGVNLSVPDFKSVSIVSPSDNMLNVSNKKKTQSSKDEILDPDLE